MSVKDMWQRTQVYFGIKEEDWEEDYFDDDGSAAHEDLESRYNERPNVRRLNPRRRSGADFDDIFSDEPPPPQRGRGRQPAAQNGGQRHAAGRTDRASRSTTLEGGGQAEVGRARDHQPADGQRTWRSG
jgi:hypothetical protein